MSIDAQSSIAEAISQGRTSLGIELGSTRIKAVLVGPGHAPIATGSHDWENQFVNRLWTYSLESVWEGMRGCFASLAADVRQRYDVELTTVGSMGISAMMHGYLAFDADDQLLVPFRTWRNTNTGEAAGKLSALFGHNIPLRWSIAHLYQAVLSGEEHVGAVRHINTLAGYVHWQLTGQKVLGVGDAAGMFPIDIATCDFNATMARQFDELLAPQGYSWTFRDIMPTVLAAGQPAGNLTEAGALLLDPSGTLQAGAPLCPPEGDAGTGMVATNSVAQRTGNVSAGTSIFAMVVLEGELSKVYPELDMVTTPAGDLVAMVHCNNGASELNAWAGVFGEFATALGVGVDTAAVFEATFRAALDGEPDAGGLLAYNYLSGEHNTGLHEGRPLFLRTPDSNLTLANFMRAQLFAMFATLRIGMDVLLKSEGVRLDSLFAHGGAFKTRGVAQRIMAGALGTPVSVGEIAGEGGAWGIAVLAAFLISREDGQSLDDFLSAQVFGDVDLETIDPDPADVAGFDAFMERFVRGLAVEKAAVANS